MIIGALRVLCPCVDCYPATSQDQSRSVYGPSDITIERERPSPSQVESGLVDGPATHHRQSAQAERSPTVVFAMLSGFLLSMNCTNFCVDEKRDFWKIEISPASGRHTHPELSAKFWLNDNDNANSTLKDNLGQTTFKCCGTETWKHRTTRPSLARTR